MLALHCITWPIFHQPTFVPSHMLLVEQTEPIQLPTLPARIFESWRSWGITRNLTRCVWGVLFTPCKDLFFFVSKFRPLIELMSGVWTNILIWGCCCYICFRRWCEWTFQKKSFPLAIYWTWAPGGKEVLERELGWAGKKPTGWKSENSFLKLFWGQTTASSPPTKKTPTMEMLDKMLRRRKKYWEFITTLVSWRFPLIRTEPPTYILISPGCENFPPPPGRVEYLPLSLTRSMSRLEQGWW